MKQFIVDAFTDKIFKGNPAAVCVLDKWLPEEVMMNITRENNLSETAFAVKNEELYELRWFTPGGEIDLCGHATLGTAYVILNFVESGREIVSFHTKSGVLTVLKKGDKYEMDMPAYDMSEVTVTDEMEQAIGVRPLQAWMGRDLVCVLENEDQVRKANPDMEAIKKLNGLLLHITAKGTNYDCVTRSFAPKLNITEDPVCGSGHCHVIPLWADKLNKNELVAYQASRRSGVLYCERQRKRIKVAGKAVLFSKAELQIDASLFLEESSGE